MFQMIFFFAFEGAENPVFKSLHFAPRGMYYRVSGARRSVFVYRTEIRQKPQIRLVDTSNITIGNTNIHIQINVSEFITILVSYVFREFNLVAN